MKGRQQLSASLLATSNRRWNSSLASSGTSFFSSQRYYASFVGSPVTYRRKTDPGTAPRKEESIAEHQQRNASEEHPKEETISATSNPTHEIHRAEEPQQDWPWEDYDRGSDDYAEENTAATDAMMYDDISRENEGTKMSPEQKYEQRLVDLRVEEERIKRQEIKHEPEAAQDVPIPAIEVESVLPDKIIPISDL